MAGSQDEYRAFIGGGGLLDPSVSKVGVVAQLMLFKQRAGVTVSEDDVRDGLLEGDRRFGRHDCTDENVTKIMGLLARDAREHTGTDRLRQNST